MTDEFDAGKLVSTFIQGNLETLVDLGGRNLKQTRNTLRVRFRTAYEGYLGRLLDHYSKGKSFFVRTEPTPLYEFFVPMDISTDRRTLRRASLSDIAVVSPLSIVQGSGGSGKTMLMRHLLIGAVRDGVKIPVFIELRKFNRKEVAMRDAILETLGLFGLDVDRDYVERALQGGHFCLLVDGFDELNAELRTSMASRIQELATRYPHNWIVLSSRPDAELNALQDFVQYEIDPLDIDSAVALVEKVPHDDEVKGRFIADLRNGLFRRHASFLSNPLLLSIMLLTYTDVAQIPSKLSLFYQQAFEALFQKHDALKGGFQRQRRSTLDIQDFASVFAAFSVLSYDDEAFSFTRGAALDYFERARKISQLEYVGGDILDDALQAVCLLVEDGLNIVYAHRSFQEYFVARFIDAESDAAIKKRLILRYSPSVSRDNVMTLLYEMDSKTVERDYILPKIAELQHRIGLDDDVQPVHYLTFLQTIFTSITCGKGDAGPSAMIETAMGTTWLNVVLYLNRQFPDLRDEKPTTAKWRRRACQLIRNEGGAVLLSDLTPSSPILVHLLEGTYFFGTEFLRQLVALRGQIEARHQVIESSLEDLLGSRTRSRARRAVARSKS